MVNECWRQIRERTSQTFNRSFERSFTRLVLEIFRGQFPTRSEFVDLLGDCESETLIKLILHYVDFKILFHEEYTSLITTKIMPKREKRYNIANLQLVALDELFLKLISNILEPY